jgi:HAD superfamily hydrolase (TIGR01450 family)
MMLKPPEHSEGVARLPGVVLDLDGTIWVDGRMIPGALECLHWLRSAGYPVVYLTNNPVRPEAYAARLSAGGVPTSPDEVITASSILQEYLRETAPGATVYVLADPDVRAQLEPSFRLSEDPAEIDVVIASSPTALDYDGLTVAYRALRRGARFLATNADPSCVAPDGLEVPHAAAVIGALEASTKRKVELVAGKPSRLAAERAQSRLGRMPSEILVVGDSLDTDVRFACENGMASVLVLTGVAQRDDLADSSWTPGHVLDSIAGLPALLEARGSGA